MKNPNYNPNQNQNPNPNKYTRSEYLLFLAVGIIALIVWIILNS